MQDGAVLIYPQRQSKHVATAVATNLETYIGRKAMWAPPSRREVVASLFGDCAPLPMLVKSNNPAERFYGILKYLILGGKAARTIMMLLTAWIQYQAKVKINAARAGIDLRKLLDEVEASLEAVPNDEAPLTTDDSDLCDADDADEEDEDVGAQSGNWDDDEGEDDEEEDASDDVESDDIESTMMR